MTHGDTGRTLGEAEQDLRRPSLVVLDVNETLSDLTPLAQRFEDVGAPGLLAPTWFAGVLRDGFALTSVGVNPPFADVAAEGLRGLLHGQPLDRSLDDAVQHVMAGITALPVHPDVPDGLRGLAAAEIRVVTLSNGGASVAEGLLDRSGVRPHVEALLSVEDAPVWKPAGAAYAHALERTGVAPADALLVAVHPWDVDGAARAGLATAWVNRDGGPYPDHFLKPDLVVGSLTELADRLASARPAEPAAQPEKDLHPLAAWFGVPSLWALAFPLPAVVVALATGSLRWGLLTLLLTVALVLATRALRR